MSHAILSPSSAKRWWNCSGSAKLIQSLGNESNVSLYSAQGTAAHHWAAMLLRSGGDIDDIHMRHCFVPADESLEVLEFNTGGKNAFNVCNPVGFWFEASWEDSDSTVSLEHVESYVDYVREQISTYGLLPYQIQIERKLQLFGVDVDNTVRTGTADCILFVPYVKLQVIDLKFGKGVGVDVNDNLQLLDYMLAAWHELTPLQQSLIPELEMTIHQPRRGGVKTVRIQPDALRTYEMNLNTAIQEAKTNPNLTAGDWCVDTFCPAKRICPAAAEYKEQSMRDAFANLLEPEQSPIPGTEVILTESKVELPQAINMTNDGLSLVLDRAPYIRNWLETMEKEALVRAKRGEVIAGHKLVERDKHRVYTNEKAVTDLLDNCGVPQSEWYAPRKLKTPNQVEITLKKYNKGAVDDAKKLAEKPKGEIILASAEDKRPAVLVADSEQSFGNLITDVEVINGNDTIQSADS